MAGILTLGQFIGGPDDLKVESTFPSSQKKYRYNFDQNITGWTFKLDYQTVIVDRIAYTREGEPNFADSRVIGYFPGGIIPANNVQVINSTQGIVDITHPALLYPENNGILPDSRQNVPLLVISFAWTIPQSPPITNMHRIAKILAWEPNVLPVDPTTLTNTNYISLI